VKSQQSQKCTIYYQDIVNYLLQLQIKLSSAFGIVSYKYNIASPLVYIVYHFPINLTNSSDFYLQKKKKKQLIGFATSLNL